MWSSLSRCRMALAQPQPVAASSLAAKRLLSIHEFQSMDLLRKYQVDCPAGLVCYTETEAADAAKSLLSKNKSKECVLKAQVLAGGRGKGSFSNGFKSGVHMIKSAKEAKSVFSQMVGHKLITKQTGPAGKICEKVYLVEKVSPKHEYYFAILLDRKTRAPMLVGSFEGGMDIEAVAADKPDAIVTQSVDLDKGLSRSEAESFAKKMKFPSASIAAAADTFQKLFQIFKETDATLVEINPLCELEDSRVSCVDAKFSFDDNADFRQHSIMQLRDYSQEDPREILASAAKLNYIGLDGSIGCLVNGAGLAMATMDIIKLSGGEPANFLDVGGGATADQVATAFKILTSDPKVSAILVNIFGGIMRCDIIAEGIIKAAGELHLTIPLVVRLQGTRVEQANELIKKSGLKIYACDDLTEASKKVVMLAKENEKKMKKSSAKE